ncbi:MAG: alpha/beta fold hydrolase [Pseudomonadota bacterium]
MDAPANGRLFAVKRGSGDDAPAVFLHGFGASSAVWADIRTRLSRERPSLAYDLPGHGQSQLAQGLERTGKMAGAVTDDLSARDIETVHLIGHSMGGAVATLIAMRTPAKVASMTLLAPGGYGPEINHRLLRLYATTREPERLHSIAEMMFGWNAEIPDAYIDTLARSRAVPGVVGQLIAILESMLKERGGNLEQGVFHRDALDALRMPVNVLWGLQDCIVPARQARQLPQHFGVDLLEGAGHMLIEECTEEAFSLICRTIASTGC